MSRILLGLLLASAGSFFSVYAADATLPPEINEKEIVRVPVPRGGDFPWVAAAPAKPVKPATAPAAGSGPGSFGGSDVIILALGPFVNSTQSVYGADGKPHQKSILTLQKSVEIEQPSSKMALRGELIKVTRDVESGAMEKLEATGNVEMVTPDQSVRGENLLFESANNEKGDVIKSLAIITGDLAKQQKAKVWNGDDWIQAYRFTLDQYRNTFKAQNSIKASISMGGAAAATPAAPKPAAPAAGGGLMGGLSMTSGGKLSLTCDGELFYEQSAGTIKLKTNINISQTAMSMDADEMTMVLEPAPANAGPAPAGGGIMGSGGLKSVIGKGRIVIKTIDETTRKEQNVIHCDQFTWDVASDRITLEMKDGSEQVKIYMVDQLISNELSANGVMQAAGRIILNTKTGAAVDTRMGLRQYKGVIPNPRPVRSSKTTQP